MEKFSEFLKIESWGDIGLSALCVLMMFGFAYFLIKKGEKKFDSKCRADFKKRKKSENLRPFNLLNTIYGSSGGGMEELSKSLDEMEKMAQSETENQNGGNKP